MWLRGVREMQGLPAWSEQAELAYFDAADIESDDEALRALRFCLRRRSVIPDPLELREVASRLVGNAQEVSHG